MEQVIGVIPMNSAQAGKMVAIVMGESVTRLRALIAERRALFDEFEQVKLRQPTKKEDIDKFTEAVNKFNQAMLEVDMKIATIIEFNCIFVPELFG